MHINGKEVSHTNPAHMHHTLSLLRLVAHFTDFKGKTRHTLSPDQTTRLSEFHFLPPHSTPHPDCRGAKETAKEPKLQLIVHINGNDVSHTFLFPGSDGWSDMRQMRDILVHKIYQV